jgi:hypothetical protein
VAAVTGALFASVPLHHAGLPDPSVPAAALAGIDAAALERAATWLGDIAVGITAAAAAGADAVAQISRGWSTPDPALRISRLLWCAEQTAGLLHAHSVALDAASVLVRDQQVNAQHDFMLATAEINALRANTWTDTVGAIFGGALLGGPTVVDDLRMIAVVRRLQESLTARLRTVEVAISALLQQLSGDPTVGPDALRGGTGALLPPDPINNPAHRTDANNRAALAADLGSGNPHRIRFASAIVESLQQATTRGGTAQLVVYDATAFHGQGRAAIAVGDLATATNVAVVVPGITTSPSAMSGGVDLAADLRTEAERQAPGARTAVVAWYGYDIPVSWTKDPGPTIGTDVRDTVAAGSAASAASGAPLLAADLTAIKGMAQTSARVTVLGFSMGSTTVSEAAKFPLPVDSLVLLGSPGVGWDTSTAAGYASVPATDVYSLSYDQDPVTLPITDRLASEVLRIADPYGVDPAAQAFGGQHIDAATNVPISTGTGLLSSVGRILGDPRHHNMKNYMQGAALAAEGAIVVGRGAAVPVKRGRR